MAARSAQLIEARRSIHALGARGQPREAADAADRALRAWPEDAELHLLRALAAERLGEWDLVIRHGERFEALAPSMAPMDISIGWALLQLDRAQDAQLRLERAIDREVANPTAWMNLGLALKRTGDPDRSIACQRRAAELAPHLPQPWQNIAGLEHDLGRPAHAVAALEELLRRNTSATAAASFRTLLALYLPETTVTRQRALAERAAALLAADAAISMAPARFRMDRKRSRALRVGFFSGDFRDHSVASFALPLLERLDREQITPLLFSTNGVRDAMTERFERTAPMIRCAGLSTSAIVESARGKQLDVAIDLSGHTSDHALAAFAARIAPVQVTWLGYPGTTGLCCFDARFVDSITDPPGTDAAATEPLVRLDPIFLVWRSRIEAPCAPRSAGDREFVFGSFNMLSKVSDATLQAWCAILERVPSSRLLLKSYSFRLPGTEARTLERFEARGIARDRIETIAWSPSMDAHLALYGRIDLALDTVPYNGTTTTCEALWMGTPVLTLAGTGHHARVGATILHSIGRDDLVASSLEAFIERAVAIARTPRSQRPDDAPEAVRAALASSPLCDECGFAERFAAALRTLWHTWCESPASR